MQKLIYILMAAAIIITGCSGARIQYLDLASAGHSGGFHVQIKRHLGGDDVPENKGYMHPHVFEPELLKNILSSLHVRQFKWGKFNNEDEWVRQQLFDPEIIDQLAASLISGFKEATAADKIKFNININDGENSIDGEVYLKNNQFNWRLSRINNYPFSGNDRFLLDSHDWVIEENKGIQTFKDPENQVFIVYQKIQENNENHPPALVKPLEKLKKHLPHSPPRLNPEQLKKKLQILKDWYESGLISESEFQREKNKIIELLVP
jgi:hypothetical protein